EEGLTPTRSPFLAGGQTLSKDDPCRASNGEEGMAIKMHPILPPPLPTPFGRSAGSTGMLACSTTNRLLIRLQMMILSNGFITSLS
ncbi:hypothetical protein CEXT_520161, partial [Caerostris extrusa]